MNSVVGVDKRTRGTTHMVNMRAAVVNKAGGAFEIQDVILDDPQPGEVLVKMVASGVCHTDMVMRDIAQMPQVFGHEGSGIIEKVGANVHDLKPGDKVLLSFASCGECRNCLEGRPAYCYNAGALNQSGMRADGSRTIHSADDNHEIAGNFFGQSSFAEYAITLPRNIVKVDDDTPDELLRILGPMGCGIQTGAGGVINSLAVKAGSSVVIFGAGGVGLSAVLGAVVSGATKIIVSDVNPERLELAKEMGATHTVNALDEDVVAQIIALTGGFGADYSVETSGNMGAVNNSIAVLRTGGISGLIGVGRPGAEIKVDHATVLYGRRVMGILEGDSIPQTFIPALIELYKSGRFAFDKMVKTYPFDQLQQAVEDSEAGTTIKGVVVF
jgi:aryl-alcohol dehydrogenase